tara:strand:+ start:163 stop:927 length:765 start_codon:yes stop_codon:yes gene_type:complete
MKYFFTSFLLIKCLFCSGQSESHKVVDTVNVESNIYRLFSDVRLEQDSIELKVQFSPISKSEFEGFKTQRDSTVDNISNTASLSENSFSIVAADTIFIFPSKPYRIHSYEGFYPQLNSHLVSVSGEGICEMFLIDQRTGVGLALPSPYDNGCSLPETSPNGQFLLIYGSCPEGNYCFNYYDHISTILIVNLSNKKSIMESERFRFIGINDWTIDEIFWIDEDKFILRGFDRISFDKNGKNKEAFVKYIKGKIKW